MRSDWQPLPEANEFQRPAHHTHLARDLIHAAETGEKPLCSGEDGRWTIEMVSAVYDSQFSGGTVTFPLKNRGNPLL